MINFFLIHLPLFLFNIHTEYVYAKSKENFLFKPPLTSLKINPLSKNKSETPVIRYEDFVYTKNIKTVQLRASEFELSQPIINLNSEEKLKFSFDDLDADVKDYSYTFIHCEADWQPSKLMPMEYVNGFADSPISNYNYSFNTLQRYTHYSFIFPTDAGIITKSGNYILKIYLDNDPDKIIITKRFMVYDNKITIESQVKKASIVEDRDYKQEIDFTIDHVNYQIPNPYNDLKIVITQNNRWDNAKTELKPTYVKGDQLVYDYESENVFDGGNEFRNFDIKSIRYHSEFINKIYSDSTGNNVVLIPAEKRAFKRYFTQPDINGDFLIKIQEGNDSEIEADYCHISFFLPYDGILTNGSLYVLGAYNGWAFNENNKMHYNNKRLGYECNLYLKQGYYNYQFAYLENNKKEADITLIEGSHSETENEYTIYIYYRAQGVFYDQLIGIKRINSIK